MKRVITFEVGTKVNYDDGYGQIQNGIVKALHPKWDDCVFVVYKCAGEWDHYQDYTGELTDVGSLKEGWI